MPRNVRLFWWISLAVVIYWLLTTCWFFVFPNASYLMMLAKLPPEMRHSTYHVDATARIASTVIWCGVTICLAWLAAYRRLNWARWAFAIVFIVRSGATIAIAIIHDNRFDQAVVSTSREGWANLSSCVVIALTIVAIVLVFSGTAKPWFKGAGD
jgi:hypothetical protein